MKDEDPGRTEPRPPKAPRRRANPWALRIDLMLALVGFAYFFIRAELPWHLAMLLGLAVGAASFSTRRTLSQQMRIYSPPAGGAESGDEESGSEEANDELSKETFPSAEASKPPNSDASGPGA